MSGGNKTHSRYVRGGRVHLPVKMAAAHKAEIIQRARKAGISANEWALRVLERALNSAAPESDNG